MIGKWLAEYDEQTAIDVIDWAHRCGESWHRQKGALAFGTLFRARFAGDSTESAAKHAAGECRCGTATGRGEWTGDDHEPTDEELAEGRATLERLRRERLEDEADNVVQFRGGAK